MSDSITFLGTSDGLPSVDRLHSALLLRLAGRTILLDCGEPCSHTLKRLGVDFNSLDAVIVTHTHSDHVSGLPMLLQSCWLERRTRPLTVWLPRHALLPLERWLRACYLFPALFKFPLHFRSLSAQSVVRIGDVRVRAQRNTHLDATRAKFGTSSRAAGFDAYSLAVEAGEKRFVYSSDLGKPRDLEPLLRRPVDLLVVELAHFDPRKLFDFLRPHDIAHVACTHLGRPMRAQLAKVQASAAAALGPRCVTFATDGDVIEF